MFTFHVTFSSLSLNIIMYILLLLIGNQTYVFVVIIIILYNFITKLYFSVLLYLKIYYVSTNIIFQSFHFISIDMGNKRIVLKIS